MGGQSYWYVHKPLKILRTIGLNIKTSFPVTYSLVWVSKLIEFMTKFIVEHTLVIEKFLPYFTFLLITQNYFHRKEPH